MSAGWTAMIFLLGLGLAAGCAAAPGSGAATVAKPRTITLSASDLYAGFEARKVALDEKGARLALDPRIVRYRKERRGVVCTDPIDLGQGTDVLGTDARVMGASIEVLADVPEGASVTVEARTGDNLLDTSGWSRWKEFDGLKGNLGKLAGRYVQVRMTLRADRVKSMKGVKGAEGMPAVTGLVLRPDVFAVRLTLQRPLKVVKADVQKIVRSPIPFHYQRPDHPKIVAFRKAAKLDEVVKGAKDDFETLVKLMDWVGRCHNVRRTGHERKNGHYAWDIDRVFGVVDGKPTIYGHCMSYCEVMVTAATAMGYVGSRHMAVVGYRERSHEVCDIWVPSLGKWVYFDPSLTQYYFDKKTKTPLNLIEMHKIVAANFVPEGKTMHWFISRRSGEPGQMVRKVGGKTPIGCRLGPWIYGKPMPRNYNWGSQHGYLCAGFVQMTERNDFETHPEKAPKRLGSYPGYEGRPFWVDAKTPPRKDGYNWYTRMRDFYWTLDQASVHLVRTAGDAVRVELGNSMPFFKEYRLTVNGEKVTTSKSAYLWKLKPGENTLTVVPVDDFGKVGLGSSVTLRLGG